MKISDILRNIASELDDRETGTNGGKPDNSQTPDGPEEQEGTTMIPPLQQKLELLKKAAGEPNAFDNGVGGDRESEIASSGPMDELEAIKKIAGLTVMIDGEQGEMGE